MANMAAAGQYNSAPATSSGTNVPFYFASNYFAKKNSQQIAATTLTTAQSAFDIALDPGGYMRGARLQVRSTGGVGGAVTQDNPWNVFQNLKFDNITSSSILYAMSGYEHMLYQAYGRPWQGNPTLNYDYGQSINPSFTLKLAPEIRHTAGVLANTDGRSLYRVAGNLAQQSTVTSGSISTAPTVTVTTYIDTWAQPDPVNIVSGNPQDEMPPGINMYTSRRKQPLALSGAGASTSIWPSGLMGSQVRLFMLVVRDSNQTRQDYLTDPITWYQDARTLSVFTPDLVQQYMEDFYGTGAMPRPTGVYVFPRFWNPGTMVGQGWMPTDTATQVRWDTTISSTATNTSGGTINMYVDEVVALGTQPIELMDI